MAKNETRKNGTSRRRRNCLVARKKSSLSTWSQRSYLYLAGRDSSLLTRLDDFTKKRNQTVSISKERRKKLQFSTAISFLQLFFSSRVLSWRNSQPSPSRMMSSASSTGVPTGAYMPSGDAFDADGLVPVDFLEGKMDLRVVMPGPIIRRMSVERRTPMMDLLVQVTTANRLSPGDFVIQVMNERSDHFLYYKPSTPIGMNSQYYMHTITKPSTFIPIYKIFQNFFLARN